MAGSEPDWDPDNEEEEEKAPEKKTRVRRKKRKASGKKPTATGQGKPKKAKRKASAVAETAVAETAAAETAAADSIAPAEVKTAAPHRLPPPPPPPNRREHRPAPDDVKVCWNCDHEYDGVEQWYRTKGAKRNYCAPCYKALFVDPWEAPTKDEPLVKGQKMKESEEDKTKRRTALAAALNKLWDEHLPNQGKFLNGIMNNYPHNWTTLYAASCDTFGVQRDPGVILGVPAYNIHS